MQKKTKYFVAQKIQITIWRKETSKLRSYPKASMDESAVLTIFADGADDTHTVFQIIAAHADATVPLPRPCAGVAGRITPAGTIKAVMHRYRLKSKHFIRCHV